MGDAELAAAVLHTELRARLAEVAEPGPCAVPESLASQPGRESALGPADLLITGWGCPALTEDLLAAAPRLKAVIHAAGSVKSLVTEAVWERGLVVSSAADANAGPVADYTMAAVVLAGKKALSTAAAYGADGIDGTGWPGFQDRQGLDGRCIGVVGASRIGRKVIARLNASEAGCQVLLYDPYVSATEATRLGVERVDLNTLCRTSTIVTLHAPERPETRWLLDAERLALIPDGGTVINTARGSLIDTEALTRECASGRLDAILDVTDPEPLERGHPLITLPNVLLTPHIAGAQGSEVRRLGAFAVGEVERWVRGMPLLGRVRREELERLA
ncbi:hydroxyacid dehydrogenase [Streptomyces sp. NPDC001262]|uniref:hydroxyacid dehydrogenase n=1 Tax=Streptomyces sp. NPDC001262 TaxID=3364552 RepID=UPI0036A2F897